MFRDHTFAKKIKKNCIIRICLQFQLILKKYSISRTITLLLIITWGNCAVCTLYVQYPSSFSLHPKTATALPFLRQPDYLYYSTMEDKEISMLINDPLARIMWYILFSVRYFNPDNQLTICCDTNYNSSLNLFTTCICYPPPYTTR